MRKKQPQPSGDEILSVLRKLEAMGRVRPVPTSYATMITWAIVKGGDAT